MPQIAQLAATYASQVFWMLIVFALIYFGIGKGMLPRISATMDARDAKIAGDLAAADVARDTADTVQSAYQAAMDKARADAQARIAVAKADAARATETRVRAGDAVSAQRVTEAEGRLTEARNAAVASLDSVAAEAARDIVTRLTGASVSEDEATAAVRQALKAE
jgi:F-type H+-transporting ATPase subunit b